MRAFGQYGQLEDGGLQEQQPRTRGRLEFRGRSRQCHRFGPAQQARRSAGDGQQAVRGCAFVRDQSDRRRSRHTQPARTTRQRRPRKRRCPVQHRQQRDGIPNAVLIRDRRIFGLNFGGVALPTGANNISRDGRACAASAPPATTCLQFAPQRQPGALQPGHRISARSDASGGEGLYLVETLQLVSDLKRTSATVSAHFDLTDNVQLFADLFAYKADAEEIVDQTAYNATLFAGSSSPIALPANHPTLTQQARDTLAGLGVHVVPYLARASRPRREQRAFGKRAVPGRGRRHRQLRARQPPLQLGDLFQLRQE